MAPKKDAKKGKDGKEAGGKPPVKDEQAAATRGDISNMLTQLKNSSDPAKQQVLQLYKSQSRFSTEKTAILKKWKMDKSCKWVNTYQQELSHEVVSKDTVLEGYGTRCCACQSLQESMCMISSCVVFRR
jgi:hypothetical protein